MDDRYTISAPTEPYTVLTYGDLKPGSVVWSGPYSSVAIVMPRTSRAPGTVLLYYPHTNKLSHAGEDCRYGGVVLQDRIDARGF